MAVFEIFVVWGMKGEIKQSPAFADAKGGENMNEPNRTEWEIRCAFNGFCKRALKYEASNAHRDVRHHQLREVAFSSLLPQEEEQLYTTDRHFANEEADDKSFYVAGMEITPKLLADAIHALPEEKRDTVLLYYFFEMSDPDAMKIVLSHYEGDMLTLSVRKMRDERGNTYYGTDQDIYDRLRSRLIRAVLDFKV